MCLRYESQLDDFRPVTVSQPTISGLSNKLICQSLSQPTDQHLVDLKKVDLAFVGKMLGRKKMLFVIRDKVLFLE